MATTHRVAVIVGSLRKESFNRKLAKRPRRRSRRRRSTLEIVEIGDLPLYNQDDDADAAAGIGRVQASRSRAPMRCCSSRPNTTARSRAC